jgi:hypothetical protein
MILLALAVCVSVVDHGVDLRGEVLDIDLAFARLTHRRREHSLKHFAPSAEYAGALCAYVCMLRTLMFLRVCMSQ